MSLDRKAWMIGLKATAETLAEYIDDADERAQVTIALNAIACLGPKYAQAKFYLVRAIVGDGGVTDKA